MMGGGQSVWLLFMESQSCFFAACSQLSTKDTWWASLAFVLPLYVYVSRQGYDVLVVWVFYVF
jgi:hypothetical protein